MKQTLHIFKKDARRHWPEILISLLLLGLYVKVTLHGANDRTIDSIGGSFPWALLSEQSIPLLMILFWVFFTVRLVHGETLVGDRQWWISKPYQWWKLLGAKLLFLLVFVCLPLFIAQLYFLRHAGFPIFPNLIRVGHMQLDLGLTLFLPSIVLASLTKSLGQALLGVVTLFIGLMLMVSLFEKIPSFGMSSAAEGIGDACSTLFMAAVIGAGGWQYARRRTWASRGLLVATAVVIIVIMTLTPYAKFVEKKYPLVDSSQAPARIAPAALNPSTKKGISEERFLPDIYLRVPFAVSDIALGHVVLLEGIKFNVETPDGSKWDPGWKRESTEMWTEDQQKVVLLEMKRKQFERMNLQTAQLHIELALAEFAEKEPREILLREREFFDPQLGICHWDEKDPSQIECLRPFAYPSLMATFDPAKSQCKAEERGNLIPEDKVSHVWFAPHDENSVEAGLNPIVNYSVRFGSRSWQASFQGNARPRLRVVYLCPGANVRLAKPELVRHIRVHLEMSGVRLLDLARNESDWD